MGGGRPSSGLRRTWPHIRAALLLGHVLSVVLLSCPGPTKLGDRRYWTNDRTQRELARWHERLRGFGMDLAPDEFDDRLWALSRRYLAVRRVTVAPSHAYAEAVGARQTWGMFRTPPRHVAGIRIEVAYEADNWALAYASWSDEHRYLARQLDHNRMRKQMGRLRRGGARLDEFSDWVARVTFAEHHDIVAVRVIVQGWDSPSPEAVRAGQLPRRQTLETRTVVRPGDS